MTTRIAINGFGRIGRAVLRSAIERDAEIEVVAVNDVTDVDTLAQLLSLDSVYGRLASPVAALDGAIEVAGRLNSFAVRAPIPTGSIVDLTVEVERATTTAAINAAFAERATSGTLAGILAYSEEPLVSADIVKSPYSAIFDAPLTMVIDDTQVKVVAWYDNEWGFEPAHGAGRAGPRPGVPTGLTTSNSRQKAEEPCP
jgi:glyceraldehyde-3-phosphate dehydrogenase/erythrose-4-phosphate dehydrogenase